MEQNTTQEPLVQWTQPADETRFEKVNIPQNLYPATIKEVQDTQGQYGDMKRLIFIVDAGDKKPEMAWVAYPRVNTKTKMGQALMALGISENQAFRWSDLVGKKCKVYVKPSTFKNKRGELVTQSCIQDISRA